MTRSAIRILLSLALPLVPVTLVAEGPPKKVEGCSTFLTENQSLAMRVKSLEEELKRTKSLYEARLEAAEIKVASYQKERAAQVHEAKRADKREQFKTAVLPLEKWQRLLIREDKPVSKEVLVDLIGAPTKVVKAGDEDSVANERWFYSRRVSHVEDSSWRWTLIIYFADEYVTKVTSRKE